ncbi:MAG: energy transducer TonB [Deltaproteobacteria bacterium]|nr:energy transducer TonB [Deltaproteobacteria bacterium]
MSQAASVFGHYGAEEREPRQWWTAVLASSVLYVGIGLLLVAVGAGTKQLVKEKPVDVTFVEKVVKPEPPPPPPPPPEPVEVKPAPPPPPVVPKDMKVRKLDKPPPPKELVAPKEMPLEAPKEADPSLDKGIAVYGEGEGDPAGLEGGYRTGGQSGPVALPEGAVAPVPSKSNAQPPYPKAAKHAGKTGSVTLKIVITAEGRVASVEVMEGEEPFLTAAVDTVKTWRYQPARHNGRAISIYRIIKVGFRLS